MNQPILEQYQHFIDEAEDLYFRAVNKVDDETLNDISELIYSFTLVADVHYHIPMRVREKEMSELVQWLRKYQHLPQLIENPKNL